MRIGLDIDEVLCGYFKAYNCYLAQNVVNKGVHIDLHGHPQDLYKFNKFAAGAATELKQLNSNLYNRHYKFDTKTAKFWEGIRPIYSKRDQTMIREVQLNGNDHDLYFITARPVYTYGDTHEWLRHHLGMTNPNLVVGVRDKGKVCDGLDIAYYLDDSYTNVKQINSFKSTKAFVLRNPYNYKYYNSSSSQLHFVPSFRSIYDFLEGCLSLGKS